MDRLLSVKTSSQLGGTKIAETATDEEVDNENDEAVEPCETHEPSEDVQVKLAKDHEN